MCGIAGIYHFNPDEPVAENSLEKMAHAIQHRGPDNQGIFAHQNAGLAYRRLSIIDTTEQPQPILTNEDQTLRIAFNGEIYNFQSIKDELIQKGHCFYTGTDTEMILHLYEEEGMDGVQQLNGIFAFALLDLRDHSLFLVRDQIGIKPLYYTIQNQKLIFASEIKAILTQPGIQREVSHRALAHYFRYRFVPDPETMFNRIYKLLPGHWMKIHLDQIQTKRYWDLSSQYLKLNPHDQDEPQIVQTIRETLTAAIQRQMIADVPLGAFLSGGIDSSIVVGTMAQLMNEPVKTFSVGFSESQYDELYYARQISRHYQTDHHEIVLTPQHVQKLPEIIWHLDEPLADPAAVPTYFLAQLARQEVTVVLTGEGGDELFAGYKEDFNYQLGTLLNFLPDPVRRDLAQAIGRLPDFNGRTRLYRSLLPARDRAEHILTDLFRFGPPPFSLPDGQEETSEVYSFDGYWEKAQAPELELDWLTQMLFLETQIWLPGDPLMKVDKMTMAHGLEARVPILDLEIVKLAARIPSRLKNKNGVEKYLLRQAFADRLPLDIFNRRKTAFEIPVREWLQNELQPMLREYLAPLKLKQSGLFNVDQIQTMLHTHQTGQRDYKYELWALLVFQIWSERWLA